MSSARSRFDHHPELFDAPGRAEGLRAAFDAAGDPEHPFRGVLAPLLAQAESVAADLLAAVRARTHVRDVARPGEPCGACGHHPAAKAGDRTPAGTHGAASLRALACDPRFVGVPAPLFHLAIWLLADRGEIDARECVLHDWMVWCPTDPRAWRLGTGEVADAA